MSTARFACLALLAACSSKKAAPAMCLTPEVAAHGSGSGWITGVEAGVCYGRGDDRTCLKLDRDGNTIARYPESEIGSAFDTAIAPPKVSVRRKFELAGGFGTTTDLKTGQQIAHIPLPGIDPAGLTSQWVGDTRVLLGGHGWRLLDPTDGRLLELPGRAEVLDATTVVTIDGVTLRVVDAPALKVTGTFQMPGTIAQVLLWFDRAFVVLESPAGTMQVDPKTATIYTGPALPVCR